MHKFIYLHTLLMKISYIWAHEIFKWCKRRTSDWARLLCGVLFVRNRRLQVAFLAAGHLYFDDELDLGGAVCRAADYVRCRRYFYRDGDCHVLYQFAL